MLSLFLNIRKIAKALSVITFMIVIVSDCNGQNFYEISKIAAGNRNVNAGFGNSVSILGNFAVAGAPKDNSDELGQNIIPNAGAAYIFKQNEFNEWKIVQKLVASDRTTNGKEFGWSVVLSAQYIIIGAMFDTACGSSSLNNKAGAVYIFEQDINGKWQEVQKIIAKDRQCNNDSYFGHSISISGNTLVVGSFQENSDINNQNFLLNSGSAYIFDRNENGIWVQKQKITASDRKGNACFSYSVSISLNYIIIGAYLDNTDTDNSNAIVASGAAYLFEKDANGNWKQVQKITSKDRVINGYFGISVSVSGNYALIGSYVSTDASGSNYLQNAGSAYIFKRNPNGIWVQNQKITAINRIDGSRFGNNVVVSGNHALIGAPFDKMDSTDANPLIYSGSAYVFSLQPDGIWRQMKKVSASDRKVNSWFGTQASISGNYMIVGANRETTDENGQNLLAGSGAAYLYTYLCEPSDFEMYDTFCGTYSLNGHTYNQSGTYKQILVNNKGCDSVLTVHLFITTLSEEISITSCASHTINGQTYEQSGTYYQTLQNESGCDSFLTIYLNLISQPKSTQYYTLCKGESITVGSNLYTKSGVYTNSFPVPNSICDSIVTTHLNFYKTIDPYIVAEDPVLTAFPEADAYQWVDCINQFKPIEGDTAQTFLLKENGEYAVKVKLGQCTEISSCIKFNEQSEIYLPTAFSPNSDGLNDSYQPVAEGWNIIKFNVFNRWGELIYESFDPKASWDGTHFGLPAPEGVYAVLITFQALESLDGIQTIVPKAVFVHLVK